MSVKNLSYKKGQRIRVKKGKIFEDFKEGDEGVIIHDTGLKSIVRFAAGEFKVHNRHLVPVQENLDTNGYELDRQYQLSPSSSKQSPLTSARQNGDIDKRNYIDSPKVMPDRGHSIKGKVIGVSPPTTLAQNIPPAPFPPSSYDQYPNNELYAVPRSTIQNRSSSRPSKNRVRSHDIVQRYSRKSREGYLSPDSNIISSPERSSRRDVPLTPPRSTSRVGKRSEIQDIQSPGTRRSQGSVRRSPDVRQSRNISSSARERSQYDESREKRNSVRESQRGERSQYSRNSSARRENNDSSRHNSSRREASIRTSKREQKNSLRQIPFQEEYNKQLSNRESKKNIIDRYDSRKSNREIEEYNKQLSNRESKKNISDNDRYDSRKLSREIRKSQKIINTSDRKISERQRSVQDRISNNQIVQDRISNNQIVQDRISNQIDSENNIPDRGWRNGTSTMEDDTKNPEMLHLVKLLRKSEERASKLETALSEQRTTIGLSDQPTSNDPQSRPATELSECMRPSSNILGSNVLFSSVDQSAIDRLHSTERRVTGPLDNRISSRITNLAHMVPDRSASMIGSIERIGEMNTLDQRISVPQQMTQEMSFSERGTLVPEELSPEIPYVDQSIAVPTQMVPETSFRDRATINASPFQMVPETSFRDRATINATPTQMVPETSFRDRATITASPQFTDGMVVPDRLSLVPNQRSPEVSFQDRVGMVGMQTPQDTLFHDRTTFAPTQMPQEFVPKERVTQLPQGNNLQERVSFAPMRITQDISIQEPAAATVQMPRTTEVPDNTIGAASALYANDRGTVVERVDTVPSPLSPVIDRKSIVQQELSPPARPQSVSTRQLTPGYVLMEPNYEEEPYMSPSQVGERASGVRSSQRNSMEPPRLSSPPKIRPSNLGTAKLSGRLGLPQDELICTQTSSYRPDDNQPSLGRRSLRPEGEDGLFTNRTGTSFRLEDGLATHRTLDPIPVRQESMRHEESMIPPNEMQRAYVGTNGGANTSIRTPSSPQAPAIFREPGPLNRFVTRLLPDNSGKLDSSVRSESKELISRGTRVDTTIPADMLTLSKERTPMDEPRASRNGHRADSLLDRPTTFRVQTSKERTSMRASRTFNEGVPDQLLCIRDVTAGDTCPNPIIADLRSSIKPTMKTTEEGMLSQRSASKQSLPEKKRVMDGSLSSSWMDRRIASPKHNWFDHRRSVQRQGSDDRRPPRLDESISLNADGPQERIQHPDSSSFKSGLAEEDDSSRDSVGGELEERSPISFQLTKDSNRGSRTRASKKSIATPKNEYIPPEKNQEEQYQYDDQDPVLSVPTLSPRRKDKDQMVQNRLSEKGIRDSNIRPSSMYPVRSSKQSKSIIRDSTKPSNSQKNRMEQAIRDSQIRPSSMITMQTQQRNFDNPPDHVSPELSPRSDCARLIPIEDEPYLTQSIGETQQSDTERLSQNERMIPQKVRSSQNDTVKSQNGRSSQNDTVTSQNGRSSQNNTVTSQNGRSSQNDKMVFQTNDDNNELYSNQEEDQFREPFQQLEPRRPTQEFKERIQKTIQLPDDNEPCQRSRQLESMHSSKGSNNEYTSSQSYQSESLRHGTTHSSEDVQQDYCTAKESMSVETLREQILEEQRQDLQKYLQSFKVRQEQLRNIEALEDVHQQEDKAPLDPKDDQLFRQVAQTIYSLQQQTVIQECNNKNENCMDAQERIPRPQEFTVYDTQQRGVSQEYDDGRNENSVQACSNPLEMTQDINHAMQRIQEYKQERANVLGASGQQNVYQDRNVENSKMYSESRVPAGTNAYSVREDSIPRMESGIPEDVQLQSNVTRVSQKQKKSLYPNRNSDLVEIPYNMEFQGNSEQDTPNCPSYSSSNVARVEVKERSFTNYEDMNPPIVQFSNSSNYYDTPQGQCESRTSMQLSQRPSTQQLLRDQSPNTLSQNEVPGRGSQNYPRRDRSVSPSRYEGNSNTVERNSSYLPDGQVTNGRSAWSPSVNEIQPQDVHSFAETEFDRPNTGSQSYEVYVNTPQSTEVRTSAAPHSPQGRQSKMRSRRSPSQQIRPSGQTSNVDDRVYPAQRTPLRPSSNERNYPNHPLQRETVAYKQQFMYPGNAKISAAGPIPYQTSNTPMKRSSQPEYDDRVSNLIYSQTQSNAISDGGYGTNRSSLGAYPLSQGDPMIGAEHSDRILEPTSFYKEPPQYDAIYKNDNNEIVRVFRHESFQISPNADFLSINPPTSVEAICDPPQRYYDGFESYNNEERIYSEQDPYRFNQTHSLKYEGPRMDESTDCATPLNIEDTEPLQSSLIEYEDGLKDEYPNIRNTSIIHTSSNIDGSPTLTATMHTLENLSLHHSQSSVDIAMIGIPIPYVGTERSVVLESCSPTQSVVVRSAVSVAMEDAPQTRDQRHGDELGISQTTLVPDLQSNIIDGEIRDYVSSGEETPRITLNGTEPVGIIMENGLELQKISVRPSSFISEDELQKKSQVIPYMDGPQRGLYYHNDTSDGPYNRGSQNRNESSSSLASTAMISTEVLQRNNTYDEGKQTPPTSTSPTRFSNPIFYGESPRKSNNGLPSRILEKDISYNDHNSQIIEYSQCVSEKIIETPDLDDLDYPIDTSYNVSEAPSVYGITKQISDSSIDLPLRFSPLPQPLTTVIVSQSDNQRVSNQNGQRPSQQNNIPRGLQVDYERVSQQLVKQRMSQAGPEQRVSQFVVERTLQQLTEQQIRQQEEQQRVSQPGNQQRVSQPGNQQRVSQPGNQQRVSQPGNQQRVSQQGNQQRVSQQGQPQRVSQGQQQRVSQQGNQQRVSQGQQQRVSQGNQPQSTQEGFELRQSQTGSFGFQEMNTDTLKIGRQVSQKLSYRSQSQDPIRASSVSEKVRPSFVSAQQVSEPSKGGKYSGHSFETAQSYQSQKMNVQEREYDSGFDDRQPIQSESGRSSNSSNNTPGRMYNQNSIKIGPLGAPLTKGNLLAQGNTERPTWNGWRAKSTSPAPINRNSVSAQLPGGKAVAWGNNKSQVPISIVPMVGVRRSVSAAPKSSSDDRTKIKTTATSRSGSTTPTKAVSGRALEWTPSQGALPQHVPKALENMGLISKNGNRDTTAIVYSPENSS